MEKYDIAKSLLVEQTCDNCTYKTTFFGIGGPDNNPVTGCIFRKTETFPKEKTCSKWSLRIEGPQYGVYSPVYTTETKSTLLERIWKKLKQLKVSQKGKVVRIVKDRKVKKCVLDGWAKLADGNGGIKQRKECVMTGQINPNRIAKLLLEGKSCGNCKYAANNLMNMNTLSTAPGVITMCMKPEGDF